MSLNLLLHVKGAKIQASEETPLIVKATVNGQTQSTGKLSSVKTVWNENIRFLVNYIMGDLWVELFSNSKGVRQRSLGQTSIPLYTVRHSNRESEGQWYILVQDGLKNSNTSNLLHIDVHFELPKNIPAKELELLEMKLNKLHTILEEEVTLIDKQNKEIKTKSLPPPDNLPGKYIYPDKSQDPNDNREDRVTITHSNSSTDVRYSATLATPPPSPQLVLRKRKKVNAREKWLSIIALPEFQIKMKELKPEDSSVKPRERKSSNLAALVNHLQGLKKIESRNFDENVVPFSTKVQARRMEQKRQSYMKIYEVKQTIDEDFRIHVYSRALQAMIYPASKLHAHHFVEKSYRSPTYCCECEQFIWGLARQGVQCQRCGKNSHKKCAVSAKHDCFHIRDSNETSVQERHIRAMIEVMNSTLRNQSEKFELLKEAFSINEMENKTFVDNVVSKVKDLAKHFSAKIKIKVLSAQGLALNSQTERRIYVSIDVGGVKSRTKSFKDQRANIHWNSEEFEFECSNILEPVKIRVWNEKHTTVSKLAHRLTSEGDLFLGQKVIEVLRIGAPNTLWYKLEKRTPSDIVSGSVQLNLSSTVAGETIKTSFHDMYCLLHEQLFLYAYICLKKDLVICSKDPGDNPEFFPDKSQMILDEFASRYTVELLYRAMVHFSLLVNHSNLPNSHVAMNHILIYIKQKLFMLSAEENAVRGVGLQILMFELFESTNFGRDRLAALLQKLIGQLLVDLQSFHEKYPSYDESRICELSETLQLMHTIAEFQNQAIGLEPKLTRTKLSNLIKEAFKESIRTTFDEIVQDQISDYYKEHTEEHPALDKSQPPFDFYYSILKQIVSVIIEDKKAYQRYINEYCDFDLEEVSTLEMWEQFKILIQDLFRVEANLHVFPPIEAIHLLLTIKKFYEERVRKLIKGSNELEYPYWFEPAVVFWIQDFQNGALNFISNSWSHDRKEGFHSDNDQYFSSSVYDMFTYFHTGQDVTQRLDGGLTELRHRYAYELAKVIKYLILHYVDLVSVEIPNSKGELRICCMLLNNLHFIRFGVQSLYEAMGGAENVGQQCTDELQGLQSILNKQLNTWVPFVISSQKEQIWSDLKLTQAEIIKLKAQGPDSRADAKAIIDTTVMDGLFECAKIIGQSSDKEGILPKLIKELWYGVMEGVQNMLLPNVPAITGIKEHENVFLSVHYNQRQCTIIDHIIDVFKELLMRDEAGVKESVFDRNVRQMKAITKLYTQPTEYLIEECLKSGSNIEEVTQTESYGQLSLEMNISRRPASGGTEGTMRVVSVINLKRHAGKAMIDFNFIFPTSQSFSKHRYTVSTASDLNQHFKFTLPPTALCELQVTIKHKPLMGADHILGVASVPFSTLSKNKLYTMELLPWLPHNERGRAFLTILSLRNSDEVARDFVMLRTYRTTDSEY